MKPRPRRAEWALPALIVLLAALIVAGLGVGEMPLSPARIWAGLTKADPLAATIVWQMRLPRILVAVLVGAALSSAGLVMQAFFRNSLANPGLLGVSSGGAAGAVIAIAAGWASISLWYLPVAAVVGAFAATGAVLAIARRGASTERLLLAGVALNAVLAALTSYVLSEHIGLYERNAQILFWLLGGLEDRTWQHVIIALPIVAAGALLWPLGRPMDLLSLGAQEAQSLGVDVRRLRRRLIVLATVLTAAATAVAGAVGFVGLVVPHLLRLAVGPEHKRLLPISLVGGAAFVLACDLAGQLSGGIRLGIVTSIIGGPFFLWMLRRLP
ncbi:MAG: FecCD family ABC transporter permease [Opitutaceae bacterium]